MSAQVAADLRAAADVLERDGWTQGDYETPEGLHCISGAINVAVCGDAAVWPGRDPRLREAKAAFKRAHGSWPIRWNDDPGRTADEAIAALHAAADAAEATA